MSDKFVFESELLFSSNGEQFVAQVRSIFQQLQQEARRAIEQGSQAGLSGIPASFTAAQGQIAAIINAKPGLSERQTGLAAGALRGSDTAYASLQKEAVAAGLRLRDISPAGLETAYTTGSKLIQETLARQSRSLDAARIATEQRAEAERRATRLLADRTALGAPPSKSAGPFVRPNQTQQADILGALSGGGITRASAATAYETQALEVRAQTAREQTGNQAFLKAKAEAAVAERQRAAAIAHATRQEAATQGIGGGTVFQQLQAAIHARSGGGDARLPADFQSLGQFLSSKALTTVGFAFSGAAIYSAVSGFKEIVREASALQRELAIVKSQFDTMGDSAGFADFSKQVVDISVNTGIAADQVALVARQLAGVFRDATTGAADFNKALAQTQVALKLSQVTGLPLQEITNAMTAITTTLGTSFTAIGDEAIGLERRFGVLAPEIIQFASEVAPVAKALGFTFDQIASLGAIAQQRSGVSGSALAESFNRALPAIQKAGVKIAEIFNQRGATSSFVAPVITALGTGNGAAVITELSKAYAVMTDNQRQALAELLGGPRAAKAFFAVLEAGKDTVDALSGSTDQYAGSLDKRFKDFQSTVEFAFERARRALEQFGLALFNSGLADGLKLVADNGALVAQFAGSLLGIFSDLNDALGGLPAKLLAVYATLKLISVLSGGVGGVGSLVGGLVAAGRGGGVAAAAPAAGPAAAFQSPYNAAAFAAPTAAPAAAAALSARGVLGALGSQLGITVAAVGIGSIVQAVQQQQAEIDAAKTDFLAKTQELLKQGLKPEEILRRIKAAGGDEQLSQTFAGIDIPGTETSQSAAFVEQWQRGNVEQQTKELNAIIKNATAEQRLAIAGVISKGSSPDYLKSIATPEGLNEIVKEFIADPTNKDQQQAIPRLIEWARNGGVSPEVAQQLVEILNQYAGAAAGAKTSQAATDYAPVLEEVRARYDAGGASLQELLAGDRTQLANFKEILDNVNASQQDRLDAAKGYATQQKQIDTDITTAAQRVSDITTKIIGLRGGSATKAAADAALAKVQTLVSQGASPDATLDAAFSAADALQKQLDDYVNSPVVLNGITRAPNSAEKLARLEKGVRIPSALREAIIRSTLGSTAEFDVVKAAADANNVSMGQLIDLVTAAYLSGNHQEIDTLTHLIDVKIDELTKFAAAGTFMGSVINQAAVQKAVDDLNAAKALLAGVDPGTTVKGDPTKDAQQAAIDASTEAQALAQALIAKQRAQANGDPVGVAQAAVDAAKQQMVQAQGSGKQSDIVNAEAALIDAQNGLLDANIAVIDAMISVAEARTSDPVQRALDEVAKAQLAIDNAHGDKAKLDALANLADRQRTLNDAVADVFTAHEELVAALLTAAGDLSGAAQAQLDAAQANLDKLLARRAAGDDPGDAAISRAQAAAVQAAANVRDTKLQTQEQNIDVALQLLKITTAQAIAQFQALLQIPNLTAQETNDILLKIKQLQGDLSRDLQFDIPSEINLNGLFYQARRINQGQSFTPTGPGASVDNRTISLFQGAVINADKGQLDDAVATVLDVISAPPRSGPRLGAY